MIIGNSIRRREFDEIIPTDDLEIIIRSAKVELTTPIKGEGIPRGTRLLKASATSSKGARRIVFLMEVEGGDLFLLFYSDKKDKIGANITIKNKTFKTILASRHVSMKAAVYSTLQNRTYLIMQSELKTEIRSKSAKFHWCPPRVGSDYGRIPGARGRLLFDSENQSRRN